MSSYDGHHVTLDGLVLTGLDSYGVDWNVEDIGGWSGAPGTTFDPVQKSRGSGAWLGAAPTPKPKSIPLTGKIDAPSVDAANDAIDRLNTAQAGSGLLEVTIGSLRRFQRVQQSDEPLPKWETDTLITWSVAVTALDPRKLADDLTRTTGPPTNGGGLTLPHTLPALIPASGSSGTVALINRGNTTGRVRVQFRGPCAAPGVLHRESGLIVRLGGLTLADAETLDVDMEARTAIAAGGANRGRSVSQRGWSGFLGTDTSPGGANTWSFLADTYGANSHMTITATPSWK